MVNRRISEDIKQCALRLWNHGWDVQDICEALGISQGSCYRWRKIFEELGTIKKAPSPLIGCTRIIARALLTAVEDLAKVLRFCRWRSGKFTVFCMSTQLLDYFSLASTYESVP
jgi:hypothetical protein